MLPKATDLPPMTLFSVVPTFPMAHADAFRLLYLDAPVVRLCVQRLILFFYLYILPLFLSITCYGVVASIGCSQAEH